MWHPSQKIEQQNNGQLTVSYQVAGTSEIKRWILGFGPLAEVLEPESLRREIASESARLASLYGGVRQERGQPSSEQTRTRGKR
jgi:predicted DNA-binding transcriptional regulator YafY